MNKYSTKSPHVVFDCDGTLISMKDDSANWKMIDLLRSLHGLGWFVTVHSGGGKDYAEMIVRRLNLAPFVDQIIAKQDPKLYAYDLSFDDEVVSYANVNVQV